MECSELKRIRPMFYCFNIKRHIDGLGAKGPMPKSVNFTGDTKKFTVTLLSVTMSDIRLSVIAIKITRKTFKDAFLNYLPASVFPRLYLLLLSNSHC